MVVNIVSVFSCSKNGELIEGTKIYADVGFSKIHDRVPGSRTIFLKLEENDEVSVTQDYETDIQDFQVSFCGALLHLEKVFKQFLDLNMITELLGI